MIDWILTVGMSLMGIAFIVLGIQLLKSNNSFGIVPIIFAFVGFNGVREDILNYRVEIKTESFGLWHMFLVCAGALLQRPQHF